MYKVCETLAPKDQHKGCANRRTLVERLLEQPRQPRLGKTWYIEHIVYVKKYETHARVITAFDKAYNSWVPVKRPDGDEGKATLLKAIRPQTGYIIGFQAGQIHVHIHIRMQLGSKSPSKVWLVFQCWPFMILVVRQLNYIVVGWLFMAYFGQQLTYVVDGWLFMAHVLDS